MNYKGLQTVSLVVKCAERDAIAWAEFVKRFMPLINFSIRRAISKYFHGTNAQEELKDIAQEVMFSLWNKNRLSEVRNKENIDCWLAIIARNATINRLRTEKKEVLIGEESYFEKFRTAQSEEKRPTHRKDAGETIKSILAILSPREKVMFDLCFQKSLKLKDISGIMRLPIGTVSSAITRMRKKIKCSKT
ncbi:MAG: sigma-70 family RNA polymerase sigma factor [Omnitrophica bacterium]|nr:sigma-70 family RNA polymerase sigma factor [Candidatus Omnitrophota bacterium]